MSRWLFRGQAIAGTTYFVAFHGHEAKEAKHESNAAPQKSSAVG
jgi:hypothetical protein